MVGEAVEGPLKKMAEQLRQRASVGALEAESLLLSQLRRKAEAAGEAPDLESRQLKAGEVADLMLALRSLKGGADRGATAATIESLIASGTLHRLVDKDGRSCAVEAVETLLELGFPFALHVSPADLELRRRANTRVQVRRWLKRLRTASIGVMAVCLGLTYFETSGWLRTVSQIVLFVSVGLNFIIPAVEFRLRRGLPAGAPRTPSL